MCIDFCAALPPPCSSLILCCPGSLYNQRCFECVCVCISACICIHTVYAMINCLLTLLLFSGWRGPHVLRIRYLHLGVARPSYQPFTALDMTWPCAKTPGNHRHTPELIFAEDPISLRCWGKIEYDETCCF